MIYKDSFWGKELKQAYIQRSISFRKQFEIGVFTGLITFSLHFMLQTVYRSVMSEAFPELMQKSYFSALSLYLVVIQCFLTVYFSIFYDYLTFAEIEKNKWYVLIKNQYQPIKMILTKLLARCTDVTMVYSMGFITTFFWQAF